MKTNRIMAAAVLIAASGLAPHVARAQQPGIKRTDLQRHDLSAPGREVLQVRVEFDPGVAFPRHWHPGEASALSRMYPGLPARSDPPSLPFASVQETSARERLLQPLGLRPRPMAVG